MAASAHQKLTDRFDQTVFDAIYSRALVSDQLIFHKDLAAELQLLDRVHTYAGFHVADVTA